MISNEKFDKLNERLKQKTKQCIDLELELAQFKIKNEENIRNTADGYAKKRRSDFQNEYEELSKNYETTINKLHDFQIQLVKEREEHTIEKRKIEYDLSLRIIELNEKNQKIEELESDLRERINLVKACESVYNDLKNDYQNIKFNNEQLKSQIQNNNESCFFTQVKNKITSDLVAENNLLKERINEYILKIQDFDAKTLMFDKQTEEIKELTKKNAIVNANFENFGFVTNGKEQQIIKLEKDLSSLKISFNAKLTEKKSILKSCFFEKFDLADRLAKVTLTKDLTEEKNKKLTKELKELKALQIKSEEKFDEYENKFKTIIHKLLKICEPN
jgi:hypothetical protein